MKVERTVTWSSLYGESDLAKAIADATEAAPKTVKIVVHGERQFPFQVVLDGEDLTIYI